MPLLRSFLKLNAGVALSGGLFTFYSYPELRNDPGQLGHAMSRGTRCVSTCLMMASDYIRAGDHITSETHYKAANRMFECFCRNGGPYIKLG